MVTEHTRHTLPRVATLWPGLVRSIMIDADEDGL